MKARNILQATVIAAALGGASLANAASNPLDPSYYAEKFAASAPVITTTATTAYRDSNNPLSPNYARNGSDAGWVQTGDVITAPYDQSANPLHSSFKRR